MPFTKQDIEELQRRAKIRGYVIHPVNRQGNTPVAKKPPKTTSKAKEWIELNLTYWCNQKGLELTREHQFCPDRKWRFDWSINFMMIAIEFEGGIFLKKSGHNTARHYTKDADKYNQAQQLGWTVLRFTAMNYTTLITQLNEIYDNKTNKA